jgi:hypothetical protein
MKMAYTYFEAAEGGYIGFLDSFPDWWTEGETVRELERMLVSSYRDFNDIMTGESTKAALLPARLNHGTVELRVPPVSVPA